MLIPSTVVAVLKIDFAANSTNLAQQIKLPPNYNQTRMASVATNRKVKSRAQTSGLAGEKPKKTAATGDHSAITITFNEIAGNHTVGQKIGTERKKGDSVVGGSVVGGSVVGGSATFTFEELQGISTALQGAGLCQCEFIVLNRPDILASVANT